ncbi:Uu.00g076900.m01.CDS01 [Anthostomella pinea]|uniref:Uu.00g076900.m01.CDS01 n=1 Tax=Anthostomella pinea TaxID=933095 RepID=A0AAI8YPB7_9PEZI|nr:Uu.00g076900.m01.CDS01 [Anthostomella pinea]
MDIFIHQMPLLYGEGSKAFVRLQEEILKVSNDHTIFTWTWNESVPTDWVSMLAPSPEAFRHSASFIRTWTNLGKTRNYAMTNAVLDITLPLVQSWPYYIAILNVKHETQYAGMHACIPIRGFLDLGYREGNKLMERMPFPPSPMFIDPEWTLCRVPLFIRSRPDPSNRALRSMDLASTPTPIKHGFLIVMDSTQKLLDYKLQSSGDLKSMGDIYLLERTRIILGIDTYPPGVFDAARSLLIIPENRRTVSGALIRLGRTKDSVCIIFLGVVDGEASGLGRSLRFCQTMPSRLWGPPGDDSGRKLLLQSLMDEIKLKTESHTEHISSAFFHVALAHEVVMRGIGP